MHNDLPITIRQGRPEDYPFILDTWIKQFWKVSPFNFIPRQMYYPRQVKVIDALLSRSTILVSHLEDEPDRIVGYLVLEPFESSLIVHWGCVKAIYRRLGNMRALLSQANPDLKPLICSHFFRLFPRLKDKYSLIYDPTVLLEIQ